MTFLKRLLAALALVSLATPAYAQMSTYSTTAASNTTVGGVSIAEGMAPGDLNDAIRATLADLASDAMRLSGAQTVTGAKTFSAAPTIANITGPTTITTTGGAALTLDRSTGAALQFARSGSNGYQIDDASGELRFLQGGSTEAGRLDTSRNLFWGTTSNTFGTSDGVVLTAGGRALITESGDSGLAVSRLSTDGSVAAWYRGSSLVGSISVTASNTAYNTSSDYRLKNISGDLTTSGAFIDALQPRVGTWKVDGSPFVGFVAHELQAVSPTSVVGEKDGPEMQAVAYGSPEIIANLVAEVKSLRTRVATLEAQ